MTVVTGIVAGLADQPPLPDFGDELGLYRLVRWAKAGVRASAWPPAERAAILAEIERTYRAALLEAAEDRREVALAFGLARLLARLDADEEQMRELTGSLEFRAE